MLLLRENRDKSKTLGQLSEELGESIDRICDAIDADKILSGLPAYIGDGGPVYVDPVEPPDGRTVFPSVTLRAGDSLKMTERITTDSKTGEVLDSAITSVEVIPKEQHRCSEQCFRGVASEHVNVYGFMPRLADLGQTTL